MSSWSVRIAEFARAFGVALVLAGLIPVAAFAVGTLLPSADASVMLGYFPDVPWLAGVESWLHARRVRWSPPTGLVYALPALALMFLGGAMVRRQKPVFDAMRARRQDAQRRTRQYGAVERVEPTLGPME